MKLSYSQIEWFLRCPYIYRHLFIERHPIARGKDAAFGGILHRVLESIYKDRPLILTLSEALSLYEAQWDQRSLAKYFPTPVDAQVHFKEGLRIISAYYEHVDFEESHIVGLEQFFEVPIEDPLTKEIHVLTGRIDRIDKGPEGLEVIDYKTNRTIKSQKQIAQDLQLSIYHLGISHLWPDILQKYDYEASVSLYFLRHTEKVSVRKTKDQLDTTRSELLEYIRQIQQAIKKDDFPPLPSTLCAREPYCRICPYFSDRYRTQKPPLPSQEEVKDVIQKYIELKTQEKQIKEGLLHLNQLINGYLDEQKLEGIYEGNMGIVRSTIPYYEIDVALVRPILEPLGKWEEVLDLSKTKLNSIKKSLPEEYRKKLEEAQKIKRVAKILRTKKV